MYKYILFDWDGCLARTLDIWIEICQKALTLYDIHATDRDIWEAMCCSGVAKRLGVPDKPAFRDAVTALLLQKRQLELCGGAIDFLRRHHGQQTMAIVSNTRSLVLKRTLRQHQLEPYFQIVIDDASGVKPKPDPEGIRLAMRTMAAKPAETIFVGDSGADIMAARRAGIASALFYPQAYRHLDAYEHLIEHQPSYVVKDFTELSMLIN